MLQIIAGSWPIAVMFIATLGALLVLRILRFVKVQRTEENEYRARQAVVVRDVAHALLIALCASSLMLASSAFAADLPIPPPAMSSIMSIGTGAVGKPVRVRKAETDERYIRRVSRPYPGKME